MHAAIRPLPLRAAVIAVALGLLAALLAVAPSSAEATPRATPGTGPAYEVWALDQGTNTIHIYNQALRETDRIEFGADGPATTRPHMIDFDSRHEHAYIANTTGGGTTVIDARSREVVQVLATGAGTHMAAVTPDDTAVWIAAIGAGTFREYTRDARSGRITATGNVLDVRADPAIREAFAGIDVAPAQIPTPVCHQYTADGRYAYVTLGPGALGGLVVVDTADASVVKVFPLGREPGEGIVRANCGTQLSRDGRTMYANWGNPGAGQPDGEWYAFDTATHTLVSQQSSQGRDAHGMRITPDGRELWMVNRETTAGKAEGLVVDTATNTVRAELVDIGGAPDILAFSPRGDRAFISLRGPNPQSGTHSIRGEVSAFSVVRTSDRARVATVTVGDGAGDLHGIEVRPKSRADRDGAPGQPRVHRPNGKPGSQPAPAAARGQAIAAANRPWCEL